ncbi:MAG TPA: hypothetical protein VK035_04175 [Kiloniellales bacterium]|nr:hypothetical protein [Kiloniellales bacterium]
MRRVLLAATALALSFGMAVGAQAASWDDADVNFVNIAVNTGLTSNGAPVDASINVSAVSGDIGHQGWHPRRDLGASSTFAAGAVNQTDLSIGRDMRAGALEVSSRTAGGADIFSVEDITYIDLEAGAAGWVGGAGGVIGVEGKYFDADHLTYVSTDNWSSLRVEGRYFESVVPQTNVLNVAFNDQPIDGSANYRAINLLGEVGNIGAINTSAIGALNVTNATIGLPGSIGDMD